MQYGPSLAVDYSPTETKKSVFCSEMERSGPKLLIYVKKNKKKDVRFGVIGRV